MNKRKLSIAVIVLAIGILIVDDLHTHIVLAGVNQAFTALLASAERRSE